jgi:membrane associated rhomboid family serine protease
MTSTQVGMRCPECAREKTRVVSARSMTAAPTLTYILVGINVLVALGVQFGGAGFVYHGYAGSYLEVWGVLWGPLVAQGEWWRLVTSGFLHANFAHLFFNMFALWILGQILEPAIGSVRFGIIYFVSLLCGSFGALLLSYGQPTVGASGAVFGLMGAAFLIMRHRGVNPLESGLAIWLGLNLLLTFVVPGLSIGGHLGGLIGGSIAALLMFQVGERARQPALGNALAVGVGALAVAGSLMLA